MKKSLIGMLLLGIMILTRALLIEDGGKIQDKLTRGNTFSVVNSDYLALNATDISPKSTTALAVRKISKEDTGVPGVQVSPKSSSIENVNSTSNLIAQNSSVNKKNQENEEENEVIPMDYVSNTGYGSWNPGLNPKQEQVEGNYPLDRGNTISDNINKLFPLRSPN